MIFCHWVNFFYPNAALYRRLLIKHSRSEAARPALTQSVRCFSASLFVSAHNRNTAAAVLQDAASASSSLKKRIGHKIKITTVDQKLNQSSDKQNQTDDRQNVDKHQ